MYPSVLIELQITGEREGWNTHSIDSMTDHTVHVVNELFFCCCYCSPGIPGNSFSCFNFLFHKLICKYTYKDKIKDFEATF